MQPTEAIQHPLKVSLSEIRQLEIGERAAAFAMRSNLRTDFDAAVRPNGELIDATGNTGVALVTALPINS